MSSDLVNAIIVFILSGGTSWAIWMTKKIILVHESQKYMNKNLFMVDWDKVPKKSLNEVFKE